MGVLTNAEKWSRIPDMNVLRRVLLYFLARVGGLPVEVPPAEVDDGDPWGLFTKLAEVDDRLDKVEKRAWANHQKIYRDTKAEEAEIAALGGAVPAEATRTRYPNPALDGES